MSRETVVWTTVEAVLLQRGATSAWVESARSRTSPRMAFCRSSLRILHYADTSRMHAQNGETTRKSGGNGCYAARAVERVLVLNASYEPLNVCSLRRAHVLVWKGKAEILEATSTSRCARRRRPSSART